MNASNVFPVAASGADWYGVTLSILNGRKITDQVLDETLQMIASIGCPDECLFEIRSQLESTFGVYISRTYH